MSDVIKHECGIALLRLKKPLQYYIDKYGTPLYAVRKLYLLMEKQHNRGQDGAGVANIKVNLDPGRHYMHRLRSVEPNPIIDIFSKIEKRFRKALRDNAEQQHNAEWLIDNIEYTGELWLGHLRYGTHGNNSIDKCHPMVRYNNWRSRNLVVAGNFNLTNVDELFAKLVDLGQHPVEQADTVTVMEKIGHFLDEEVQRQFLRFKNDDLSNMEITSLIEEEVDLQRVLNRACRDFDGGYTMAGLTGFGAAFVARDPHGIRPAYYYENDEVVVAASEKPAIKTAFNAEYGQIHELPAGHALLLDKHGNTSVKQFLEAKEKTSCSFERIYFSRGSDPDIYQERKMLGRLLTPQILESIDYDIENTVFSYIPNTAETAFLGMMAGLEQHLLSERIEAIQQTNLSSDALNKILSFRPRVEKLVIKDVKLRTFITDDEHRDDMVAHVYDTTYEVIRKGIDTIVVIDDSIVRGTTLEKSILTMLDRLGPKQIIIVSSAPQIRYPDCYGIDMSRMNDFVAFRAAVALLKERGMEHILHETFAACVEARKTNKDLHTNFVQQIYAPFTQREISDKVAEIVTPRHAKATIKVVYQTVENLHKAIPNHTGDWYFTGNYPTPGGNRVVNQAFVNFMEKKSIRAYS
jgi:amidophosphoribosyltransferase